MKTASQGMRMASSIPVRLFSCSNTEKSSCGEDLKAYWLPFTNNRYYKSHPRILDHAEGPFYYTKDGKEIFDGCSGLWCVNAGHGQKKD